LIFPAFDSVAAGWVITKKYKPNIGNLNVQDYNSERSIGAESVMTGLNGEGK